MTVITKIEIGKVIQGEPKDSYHLVHILFFCIGLVRMLPWTFFVTANKYWMYKFRNITSDITIAEDRSDLQADFSAALMITLQLSNVTFLFLGMCFGHKMPVRVRLVGTLLLILLLFIVSASFININTDSWQITFFIISMVIVGITNAITSTLDITTCAIISSFPPDYLGVNLNGQGAAGICTAALQIMSLTMGLSVLESASVYFSLGIAIITFTLILMLSMKKNQFYIHHLNKYKENSNCRRVGWTEIKTISKKIRTCIVVFVCYIIAYNPVSGTNPLVVSENQGEGPWNDVYFVPVITFLLASVSDVTGRSLAIKFNNWNEICLCIVSIVRVIVFIPLLMLCNAQPRSHLPVIFPHDYQYILILVAFRISSGYMVCLCSLNIPKLVDKEECKNALQVFAVLSGIFIGIFSFLNIVSVKLL